MGLVSWLRSLTSSAARAETVYKRGVAKARSHDFQGAIDDYTEVINGEEATSELKTMSRLNRGVAYSASRQYALARDDLKSVLAGKVPPEVASAARAKIARIDKIESLEHQSPGRASSLR